MESLLPKFHSVPEIARLTGLSESLIRDFVRSGQLRAMRASSNSNSRIKLRLEDVSELFERLTAPQR